MGQYFKIFNMDKKLVLNPRELGDGLKFLELALSGGGVMAGLAFLLRQSTERGGGDTDIDDPLVGSWAGDRVAIVGDYDASGIYADESYRDISAGVAAIVRRAGEE
jgi:hypothetical protein